LTKPMKMDALQESMALGATDDGRWFAACAPLAGVTLWVSLLQGTATDIPSAPGPLHEPGQEGYCSCEEAIAACRAWLEAAGEPIRWRALAAHTEVYPERNVWYLEEIQHLAGATPMVGVGVADAYAVVIARDCGRSYVLDAVGASPDEAIEALYQRTYDRLCDLQEALQRCAR
jgi:hypothetical protein